MIFCEPWCYTLSFIKICYRFISSNTVYMYVFNLTEQYHGQTTLTFSSMLLSAPWAYTHAD